jgi:hypothetical protein
MTLEEIADKIVSNGKQSNKNYKKNDVQFKIGNSIIPLSRYESLKNHNISRFSTNLYFAE